MKETIYKHAPLFLQNLMVSMFNYLAYKTRYGGKYREYLNEFIQNRSLSSEELKKVQSQRFDEFLKYTISSSDYFRDYPRIGIGEIQKLPILNKETLRENINEVYTVEKSKGVISKTGGTTGKSLEVVFTNSDMQERFAMLDDFRARFGYKLGKKTAWFSGKNLLTSRDINNNRFWKTDYLYKVRYYSTFHIKEDYLRFYVENLIKFSPEYIVGFPSSIMEIAKFGLKHGYHFPNGTVKAIFPTAETITTEMRDSIEAFFKCKMYNQYASSEGAPFIFECKNGKLHLELQSGVFEVLDEDNEPTQSGKLVVTSFTTKGTPLIRYDIGDSISLEDSDKVCNCGNNNPLVKEILGRADDYVYSPENGKINLGNISNTLKDTRGIKRFQVVQNKIDEIELFIETDKEIYNASIENKFMNNWRDRVGQRMDIQVHYVDDIEVENSGKYRMVKNNIKHLL